MRIWHFVLCSIGIAACKKVGPAADSTRVASAGAPIVAERSGLQSMANEMRDQVQLLVNRARRLVGP